MPDRPEIPAAELRQQRDQLIEIMSAISEERYCSGWHVGLDRALHEEGGVWEHVGRAIGWPVGDYRRQQWMTWDEAAKHYATKDGARRG